MKCTVYPIDLFSEKHDVRLSSSPSLMLTVWRPVAPYTRQPSLFVFRYAFVDCWTTCNVRYHVRQLHTAGQSPEQESNLPEEIHRPGMTLWASPDWEGTKKITIQVRAIQRANESKKSLWRPEADKTNQHGPQQTNLRRRRNRFMLFTLAYTNQFDTK